jgi:hypothetical protein
MKSDARFAASAAAPSKITYAENAQGTSERDLSAQAKTDSQSARC